MRNGLDMVLNVDKMVIDFKHTYTGAEDIFPSDLIFDKVEWNKEENHMKIVASEEAHGMVKSNDFSIQPTYKLCYLTLAKDDPELLQKQIDGCPHVDRFKCVRVHNRLFDD